MNVEREMTWQERLLNETADMAVKINRLKVLLGSEEAVATLHPYDVSLMRMQLAAMELYSNVLNIRCERLKAH